MQLADLASFAYSTNVLCKHPAIFQQLGETKRCLLLNCFSICASSDVTLYCFRNHFQSRYPVSQSKSIEVNICIQSKYRKIRTRNNSVFGHFSRSDTLKLSISSFFLLAAFCSSSKHRGVSHTHMFYILPVRPVILSKKINPFHPVSYFYTSWKRQKTFGFLTFSGDIEMWHWTKMG